MNVDADRKYVAPEENFQVNRRYLVTKVSLQSESVYFWIDISQLAFHRHSSNKHNGVKRKHCSAFFYPS